MNIEMQTEKTKMNANAQQAQAANSNLDPDSNLVPEPKFRLAAPDEARDKTADLRDSVENMHSLTETYLWQIGSLASVALAGMEGGTVSACDLGRTLEVIAYLAQDGDLCIAGEAKAVGCASTVMPPNYRVR